MEFNAQHRPLYQTGRRAPARTSRQRDATKILQNPRDPLFSLGMVEAGNIASKLTTLKHKIMEKDGTLGFFIILLAIRQGHPPYPGLLFPLSKSNEAILSKVTPARKIKSIELGPAAFPPSGSRPATAEASPS